MEDLGTLGGTSAAAVGISAVGQIVGYASTAASEQHAFSRDPDEGDLVDLGTLGGTSSHAVGVNAVGQVAGSALTADGSTHAALFSAPPPYDRVKEVADALPATPKPFADAKARLAEALDPALWNARGTELSDPSGMHFFDRVKQAVDRLDKVANSAEARAAVEELWAVAEEVATEAVDDAAATPGAGATEVERAQRHLASAGERWATNHSDAFEGLKQAWRTAEGAVA
jgi:probable HAF family extracellular repeat protein